MKKPQAQQSASQIVSSEEVIPLDSLTPADYEKIIEQLSDLIEEVEHVHKAIKNCASEGELEELMQQEDNTVIDYISRINQ